MLVLLENSGKQCASELPHSRVGIWGICTPAAISHWLNAAGNLGRGEALVPWPAIQARNIPRENGFCAGGCRGSSRHRGKGTGSCKFSGSILKDRGQGIWVGADSVCNTLLNTHWKYQSPLALSLWETLGAGSACPCRAPGTSPPSILCPRTSGSFIHHYPSQRLRNPWGWWVGLRISVSPTPART